MSRISPAVVHLCSVELDQWTSKFDTRAVAYGETPDFGLEDADPAEGEFLYGRLNNPTRFALEQRLASLESGDYAFAVSSGTAAIATALLAALEPGDTSSRSTTSTLGRNAPWRRSFETV